MNSKIFFISILVFLSVGVFAQHHTSSPYSRYGFGELSTQRLGPVQALGGASTAYQSPFHINFDNPASYAALRQQSFIFEIGLPGKYTNFITEEKEDGLFDVNLGSIAIGFPINKWMKMSIGLLPYSYMGYDLNNEEVLLDSKDTPIAINQSFYEGIGGVNRLYFGNSIQFLKYFSVGYNANFLFGKSTKESITKFETDSELESYSQLSSSSSIFVGDIYLDLGLQFSKRIKDKYFIGAGLTYNLQQELKGRQTSEVRTDMKVNDILFESSISSDTINDGNITIPKRIGIGLTFGTPKFMVLADYTSQSWGDALFFGKKDINLANTSRISAGLEYIPNIFSTDYLKVVRYRIGGQYSKDYLQILDEASNAYEQLKDYSVSFGFEFPLRQSNALIDVGFELGQRGTGNKNHLKEKYAVLHLNFSLQDVWFRKYKFF